LQYITTDELSEALGLRPEIMSHWPDDLKPPQATRGVHRHKDVNTWLAERAKGFAAPPTIEDILSGKLRLILREFATPQLIKGTPYSDGPSYTWRRIAKGDIESIHLRTKTWVVSVRSVQRYIHNRTLHNSDFTLEEVGRIFGFYGASTRGRVVTSGKLVLVQDPAHTQAKRALRESVLALLRTLLAQAESRIDAEDWIDDRLHSTERLLTVRQTAERLGLIEDDVRHLLRCGEMSYIPSPEGSKWFVSPDSVAFYQEHAPPLNTAAQGAVFGVGMTAVSSWRSSGIMICPLHPDEEQHVWYRWCLVALVKKGAYPGVDAARWVRLTLDSMRMLVPENTVLKRGVITQAQLVTAVEEGRLQAIRTPAGMRVYGLSAVHREIQRLQQLR